MTGREVVVSQASVHLALSLSMCYYKILEWLDLTHIGIHVSMLLCKADCTMYQSSRGINMYCVLCVWALHSYPYSASGSFTSCIRGNAYGLITQITFTNYNYFIYWIHMLYTYSLQPYTIWTHLTVTYLSYCVSVPSVLMFLSLLSCPSNFLLPSDLFLLYFLLYMLYECWYHSSGDPVIPGEGYIR